MRRPLLAVLLPTVVLAVAVPAGPAAALSTAPDQNAYDSPASGSTQGGGRWTDLPGGQAARPYVSRLAVVDGGTSTTVFSGGVDAAKSVAPGNVTATVAPVNLCGAGQSPASGQCYATPNRIQINVGYATGQGTLGLDFSRPLVPLAQQVDADTEFDLTIKLNTLGQTLRWTWAQGDIVNWKASDLGQRDAELHVRIKALPQPDVDFSALPANGCTATPIRDCDIAQATGSYLGAGLLLSLDTTLDPTLTGAAFATSGAVLGLLVPGGGAASPTFDLQVSGPHLAADGSLARGSLEAFFPESALLAAFGVLPQDATTFFSATRRGDAGSAGTPRFTAETDSGDQTAGLRIAISGISFSTPTFRVARKAPAFKPRARRRGSTVTVSAGTVKACRTKRCTATVYRSTGTQLAPRTKKVATATLTRGRLSVKVAAKKLPQRSAYVVAVRRGGKGVASASGKVS